MATKVKLIDNTISPTLAGGTFTGHIHLGDSDQVRWGGGNDGTIHHDGSHFRLRAGTGNFNIQTDDFHLTDSNNTLVRFRVDADGPTRLYHNGNQKLETSSVGATVSGTLTVTGDLDITGNVNSASVTDLDVTDKTITLGAGQTEGLSGGSGIIVDGSGASILWDETNSEWDFNANIKTTGSLKGTTLRLDDGNSLVGGIFSEKVITGSGTSNDISIFAESISNGGEIHFMTNGSVTKRLTIDTSGNVGIGVTPGSGIQLSIGNSANNSAVTRVTNGTVSVDLTASSSGKAFLEVGTSHPLILATAATERMVIEAGGDVSVKAGKELRLYRTDNATYGSLEYMSGAGGLKLRDVNGDGMTFAGHSGNDYINILGSNGNVGINHGLGGGNMNSKFNVFADGEAFRLDGTGGTSRTFRFRGCGTNGSSNAIITSDGILQLKNEDANAAIYLNSVRDIEFQTTSGNGTAGHMRFYSYNTQIMHIDGANNRVGIGTDSPSQQLTVFNSSAPKISLDYSGGANNGGSIDFNLINAGVPDALTTQIKVIDDGAYRQHLAFLTKTTGAASSGMTERMRMTSAGNLQQLSQSRFHAYGGSTGYNPLTYSHSVVYPSTSYNIGSDYSGSTGLYTAPCDGFYIFEASIYSTSTASAGWGQAWLTINGGRGNYTDKFSNTGSAGGGVSIISTIHTVYLSSGDTVGYHPYTGSGSGYAFHTNVHHTWFRGRLIG